VKTLTHSKIRTRITGLIGLLLVAALVFGLLGIYLKLFKPVVEVTVMSDRAGLLLDKGSSVRAYGVPVGEVRGTRTAGNGQVEIKLALDPDKVDMISEDVDAVIRATTVFGAKFVELRVPADASDRPVSEGAVIQAVDTTVEANDTFQHAMELIQAVSPRDLNNTLTQMATALEGRGEQLGAYLTQLNTYLTSLNRHLPTLAADIRLSRDVLGTYADVAPELIATADQGSTTAVTFSESAATMHAFLVDLTQTSRTVGIFLDSLEEPLVDMIVEGTPVTNLLRVYAPEIGCLLDNLSQHAHNTSKSLAGQDAGTQGRAGLLPGQPSYDPRVNLPKIVTGVGPICYPQPTKAHPLFPHIRFDDGTQTVYDGVGPVVNPGRMGDPFGNEVR